MTTIESLFSIPDIFFEILKKLTPEDLIVQSFVCKKWYQFCSDDYLWGNSPSSFSFNDESSIISRNELDGFSIYGCNAQRHETERNPRSKQRKSIQSSFSLTSKLIGRKFNWKKIFLRRFSVQVTEFYQSFSEWGLKGLVEFFLRFYVNPGRIFSFHFSSIIVDRIYINKKRLLDHYYGGYNYTLPCAMIQLGAISEMPQLNAFMNDWIIKPCYICNPEKKAMSDIVKVSLFLN